MKRNFLLLFSLFSLFGSFAYAETPNVRFDFSEDVEYCENCREHSMDGWILKFRLINLSNKPVLITGFWFRDSNDNKYTDPKYFYPNFFAQSFNKVNCRWSHNGKNEKPLWTEKRNFLKDDTLTIIPIDFYELDPIIGWDFDEQHFLRYVFIVRFENEDEFYEIESPAFSLLRNDTNNSGKIIIEENPCEKK